MIRLYPEQLRAQLNEGLRAAYLLLGNDPLLLQESQDAIRQVAAAQGFEEHHTFSIDPNTDWNAIFSLCQAMSLFASRRADCGHSVPRAPSAQRRKYCFSRSRSGLR